MSNLDEFNQVASKPVGGRWVKLKDVGDEVKGELLDAAIVDRTDPEGIVVMGRKSGKPRKIWRLTIQTDQRDDAEDDGVRVFDANESAQSAIRDLLPFNVGGRIVVRLTAAAADSFSQATYQAAYKAPEPAELLSAEAGAADDLSAVL